MENNYNCNCADLFAFPTSVKDNVPNCLNDARTLDKLLDGTNDTHDDRHMWLAPLQTNQSNFVYVVFDDPVPISMIKIWNYSKTPSRGVEEFELFVDDALIYKGILKPAPGPQESNTVNNQTILFGNDMNVIKKERKNLIFYNEKDQDIILFNNNKLMDQQSIQKQQKDAAMRKQKMALGVQRPMTATTGKL